MIISFSLLATRSVFWAGLAPGAPLALENSGDGKACRVMRRAGPGSGWERMGPFQEAAEIREASWKKWCWAGAGESGVQREGIEAVRTLMTRLFPALPGTLTETVDTFHHSPSVQTLEFHGTWGPKCPWSQIPKGSSSAKSLWCSLCLTQVWLMGMWPVRVSSLRRRWARPGQLCPKVPQEPGRAVRGGRWAGAVAGPGHRLWPPLVQG